MNSRSKKPRWKVNTAFLRTRNPDDIGVAIERAGEEAEMDKMWSFVGNKGNPRWLWHAIDHQTGQSWGMFLGAATMRFFCRLKHCWSLLGLPAFLRIIGAPTPVIWTLTCIAQANVTPRQLSAGI